MQTHVDTHKRRGFDVVDLADAESVEGYRVIVVPSDKVCPYWLEEWNGGEWVPLFMCGSLLSARSNMQSIIRGIREAQ